MEDYPKPCIKEDKRDHLIPHVGTNGLASQNNAEKILKSIVDLAKCLVTDDRTISFSRIVPKNDKLNSKAAEENSYVERICSNVNMHFIDITRVINLLSFSVSLK